MFRLLLGVDVLATIVLWYFFFAGIGDGSVSDFNIQLWVGVLLGTAAIIAGGVALRRAGKRVLANIVLAILAAPTAFYGFFILVILLTGERWN